MSTPPEAQPAQGDPERSLGEAYRAVRSHELMLNQATSAFEHAVLVPLTAVNGGALVAFLALVGAVADKGSRLAAATGWVAAATAAWSLGLIAAAFATSAAFRKQRAINKGYRALREDLERLLFKDAPDLIDVLKGPEVSRATQLALAENYGRQFEFAWWAGVSCFVLGAISATVAIV